MHNFFLILLNGTFTSFQETKDRIFKCTSGIYSDIKNYKEFIDGPTTRLYSFIEKYCSITKYSSINSNILPKSVIISSNKNDIMNVITQYNNTYLEYEEIASDNTEDLLCPINSENWSDWILTYFNEIYAKICTYNNHQCIAQHNTEMLNYTKYTLHKINNVWCAPTTNPSSNDYFNHNITNTTNDDSHFNTHDSSSSLIYWIQIIVIGAGIFTLGCYTKKIIDYIQKQYCTPNTHEPCVQIVNTPEEAIQMYQREHSVEPLYQNVNTIGNIEENIAF